MMRLNISLVIIRTHQVLELEEDGGKGTAVHLCIFENRAGSSFSNSVATNSVASVCTRHPR